MIKLYYIVGLPASGKTSYMNYHFDDSFYKIDDINSVEQLPEHLDKPLVITDPTSVYPKSYKRFIDFLFSKYNLTVNNIKTFVFENNFEQCIANAKQREGKPVISFILNGSKHYNVNIYHHSFILPVYNKENLNILNELHPFMDKASWLKKLSQKEHYKQVLNTLPKNLKIKKAKSASDFKTRSSVYIKW